jgi:hypothetical protein
MLDRTRMLKDQAKLLRELAQAPGQPAEVCERMRTLARECEKLGNVLERSIGRGSSANPKGSGVVRSRKNQGPAAR